MIPRKPETIAWIVLWASFTACLALAIAVPTAGRWYVANATDGQEATLEIIGGTVLVQDPVSRSWIGASNKMRLREGDGIRTDEVSRALVTLFDGSPIFLSPRTEVVIVRSQASKFDPKTNFVTLRVQRGFVRVAVAPQLKATQAFLIQTPHATGALLKDGSYSVEVTDASSQIAVREGEVRVAAAGAEVNLKLGQRTTVLAGQPPSPPEKSTKALVANGDFRQGLAGWREYSILEVPGDVAATVAAEEVDGQGVVHLVRQGSRNSHAENGIVQMINRDVSDFLSLKLSLDVYVSNQSLSGGGFRGSEYPAMVQIRYRDVNGNEQLWVRGFYYHNRDNYSTLNGELVLQEKWYPFERAILGPNGINPRPFYIISVQILASGWDYDSMARAVNLVGE
jgi:hypothetical protein